MPEINVEEIMRSIPDHFVPEKAAGMDATIQCIFSGDQASNWVITIQNQTCTVKEDLADDPDITIRADAEVGTKILTGRMDPMRAYLLRKVRVSGDMSIGMKLVDLFAMA